MCKCALEPHKKDLTSHALTKKHIESLKFSNELKQTKAINTVFESEKKKLDARKLSELKLAAFIAKNCAISTVDELCELLPQLDENSQLLSNIKLHRTKCTGLITNVLSPCMLESLIEDIGDSYFSMVIDESTSVDTKKMMCIMIRYFSISDKCIKTTFYRLLQVDGGTADILVNAFINQLKEDKLNIDHLIGIGVDGANVMVGEHHSFSSLLSEKIPHLVTVKCVAHSLHLVAEKACMELPAELEFLVKECYSWFSSSSKRQDEYSMLHETLVGKKPLKFEKMSGTRWLARINCITKILNQWDALKLHFKIAESKEKCYSAKQLFLLLSDIKIEAYLKFLKSVLKKITDVNQMFQSDQVDSLKLLGELYGLLLYYLGMLVPPDRLKNVKQEDLMLFKFEECIMNIGCIHFGYEFNLLTDKIEKEKLTEIKKKCVSFIIVVCKELQKRIPKNIRILENISMFNISNSTSQLRPTIDNFVIHFKDVVGQTNIDATLNEWRVLPLENWQISDEENTETFWVKVYERKNAMGQPAFKNICKLVLSVLIFPFSNATVERAFSVMGIVKNKLRNRLLPKTTDHIMRVRFCIEKVSKFQPTQNMLKKFNSECVYQSSTSVSDDDLSYDIFSDVDV